MTGGLCGAERPEGGTCHLPGAPAHRLHRDRDGGWWAEPEEPRFGTEESTALLRRVASAARPKTTSAGQP